jgi:hypothetical protein
MDPPKGCGDTFITVGNHMPLFPPKHLPYLLVQNRVWRPACTDGILSQCLLMLAAVSALGPRNP